MNSGLIFDLGDGLNLRQAAKSATMRHAVATGMGFMTAAARSQPNPLNDDSMFDDADALIALAQRSFAEASKAAVAENDRLGIPTHGSIGGKLVTRTPPKTQEQG